MLLAVIIALIIVGLLAAWIGERVENDVDNEFGSPVGTMLQIGGIALMTLGVLVLILAGFVLLIVT